MTGASSEQVQELGRLMMAQIAKTEQEFRTMCGLLVGALNEIEVVLIHGTMAERAMAADEVRDLKRSIATMLEESKGRSER